MPKIMTNTITDTYKITYYNEYRVLSEYYVEATSKYNAKEKFYRAHPTRAIRKVERVRPNEN